MNHPQFTPKLWQSKIKSNIRVQFSKTMTVLLICVAAYTGPTSRQKKHSRRGGGAGGHIHRHLPHLLPATWPCDTATACKHVWSTAVPYALAAKTTRSPNSNLNSKPQQKRGQSARLSEKCKRKLSSTAHSPADACPSSPRLPLPNPNPADDVDDGKDRMPATDPSPVPVPVPVPVL